MDYTPIYNFEVKDVSDSGRFTGYAAVFSNVDLQGDVCEPGCFRKTIAESRGKVPILMGHIMARIVGFGLDAAEDSHGLKVTGEFTLDSDEGRNAFATSRHAARVGAPIGLSIGYGVAEGGYKMGRDGTRSLHEVTLWEYSITPTPANPRARISSVKCADLQPGDWERLFRDQGFSKRETERLVHACKGLAGAADEEDEINDLIAFMRSQR